VTDLSKTPMNNWFARF